MGVAVCRESSRSLAKVVVARVGAEEVVGVVVGVGV